MILLIVYNNLFNQQNIMSIQRIEFILGNQSALKNRSKGARYKAKNTLLPPLQRTKNQLNNFLNCNGAKLHSRRNTSCEQKNSILKYKIHYFSAPTPEVYQKAVHKSKNSNKIQTKDSRDISKRAKHLPIIDVREILLKKGKIFQGYWMQANTFVVLLPCVDLETPVIDETLQALGRTYYQEQSYYVVSKFETINSYLNQFNPFSQLMIQHYIRQLVTVLATLHKKKISHNRLTLNAVIVDLDGKIHLNHFISQTTKLKETEKEKNIYFYPPEVVLESENCFSEKCDIWGVGCITLQLFLPGGKSLYHPYNKNALDQDDFKKNIETIQQTYIKLQNSLNVNPTNLSSNALQFIRLCLNLKAEQRPTAQALILHPFLL